MRTDRLRAAGLALTAVLCLAAPAAAVATPRLLAQAQTPATPPASDAAAAPATAAPPAPTPAGSPVAAPLASPPPTPAPPTPAAPADPADPDGPNLSPWAMFLHADLVVKGVMVGLAFASVVVWTILLVKGATLLAATLRTRRAVGALAAAEGLEDDAAAVGARPVRAMIEIARDEIRRSASLPPDGVKERAALSIGRIEARAARGAARGAGLIATIGSTAPFVGLFGTVWGIMDSFIGITRAHTSNLAVVAPGIAEALLATAIGLVAAIPAVVIYNGFARATSGYKALLGDASAEVMRHLSRDLDRRDAGRTARGYQAAE